MNWIIILYIALPSLLVYQHLKVMKKGGATQLSFPLMTKKMGWIINSLLVILFALIIGYWAVVMRSGEEILTGIVTITGSVVLVGMILRTNRIIFKEEGILVRSWFMTYEEIVEFRMTDKDQDYANLMLKVRARRNAVVVNHRIPIGSREEVNELLKATRRKKKKKK